MNRILSLVVGALWVLAVVQIAVPVPELKPAITGTMTGILVLYLLLIAPRISRHSQILCAVLGAVTVLLAAIYGRWDAIPDGFARAAIFPAFLATLVLLRATANQRPEISAARRMFGALDPARRDSGIIIGTHLIGVILSVGVFAVIAPILRPGTPAEERREVFTAAIRGMAMVSFWSPFIVAMGVASQYLPMVPLWQIMSLGLSMTLIGICISFLGFDRNRGIEPLLLALRSLGPVAVPILVAAIIVVATSAATGFSTLKALIVALPVPCLLAVLQTRGGSVKQAVGQTFDGLSRIGPETSIICVSTILGMVFEASLPATGLVLWLESQALSPTVVIFTIIMSMNIAGLLGVHPIVTGTVLLVIFTTVPNGVADLVLMQTLLIGWGLCSGISIGSLSVATGAAMFRLPPTQLVTRKNIVFVFSTSVLFCALLSVLNLLLT
tara:strand:+ start:133 stop:1455 length:1323 start_codon:yes stop_codon:yes gene_type:complete